MNYPPKIYKESNFNNIVRVIEEYPLATLISFVENDITITHIPLMYENNHGKYGKLIGHIDKNNPQLDQLKNGNDVTILFHGPDAYISPSLFNSDRLPTWNYVKVHIKGTVNRMNSHDQLRDSLIKMTQTLEAPAHSFSLTNDISKTNALLDYIVGLEITINDWEGKFKLSQDKPENEIHLAKEALADHIQKDRLALLDRLLTDFKK